VDWHSELGEISDPDAVRAYTWGDEIYSWKNCDQIEARISRLESGISGFHLIKILKIDVYL
jgi:hypothetical protein